MKREFLQGLLVGEMALPKEVIDAIMAENGRDIEKAKGEAVALLAEKETWEETLRQMRESHETALQQLTFSHRLENTIRAANGRNEKAICALLDMDALRNGEEKDITSAVEKLREEAPYLFERTETPPPYARGTGAASPLREEEPATLAGALKQRFMKERK